MSSFDPALVHNTLELAFVVYAAEEFGNAPSFPPRDKMNHLIEAISSQYGDHVMISAEDVLNSLFEKYNIQ